MKLSGILQLFDYLKEEVMFMFHVRVQGVHRNKGKTSDMFRDQFWGVGVIRIFFGTPCH